MSWRTVEEPGPNRVIDGVRYRAWHNPEQHPGVAIYVEQHGGAGGPRRYAAVGENHDHAVSAGRAFAHHLRPDGFGIELSGGVCKAREWWVTFNIAALD